MRLYGISAGDVEAAVANPSSQEADEKNNMRITGQARDGHPILVVLAEDDPGFVITVFPRS